MPETTPAVSRFDQAYRSGTAPWVIGEPQPAIIALEQTGLIRGDIIDIGCGAGEHTILLTRLGYRVTGVDFAPHAIEAARANAAAQGVTAHFDVADALHLDSAVTYDTVIDSALFHIFDDADRARYVAGLYAVCRAGGVVHVLALSDAGRGFGPEVSEETIRTAFGTGWALEDLATTTYRGIVGEAHAEALGLPVGTTVDEPAWLARARRL
ncbi:MAG: class I SAM-dependent methyltransferase [Mycobacterium sp.]